MKPHLPLVLIALTLATPLAAADAADDAVCPPPSWTRTDLLALKQAGFVVSSEQERNRLAVLLLACFEDPDPAIRDGVVFEGLSGWLRAGALEPETIRALAERLSHALAAADADRAGFRGPFAALLLSEVARADRLQPVLADAAREELVDLAARYLAGITDYRGFDPVEGWRHGVAHGADLVLQLGLNARVSAAQVERLLGSLARQVAPTAPISYTFGEPERFARTILFLHRRGVLDDAFWDRYFTALGAPSPLPTWADAYTSLPGLARRHNTLAFLHAVAFAGRIAADGAGQKLTVLAEREIARVMGM